MKSLTHLLSSSKRFKAISAMLFLLSIGFSNSTQAQVSHPYAGSKTAFMHEDARSSDVFSGVAPEGKLTFKFETKQGAVPTILQGNDELLQVICVRKDAGESETLSPYLLLLDPKSMKTLTTLKLPSGTALNNIYGYLNEKDELMLANGRTIFRIVHFQKEDQWNLQIEQVYVLETAAEDFQFVAITPDWKGNIWFASFDSQVGFLNPNNGTFKAVELSARKEEMVANSISSCPEGIAVATTHSLYVLNELHNEPSILWHADYDRGNRVKPGKLSWGTGSSPSLFGPNTGFEYLTILDSGTSGTHLNIYDSKTGKLIAHE